MRNEKSIWKNTDWTTVFIYVALVLMGWISIYAAVYDETFHNIFSPSQRYGKQAIFIIVGLVIAMVTMLLDGRFFQNLAPLLYILFIVLLVGVLVVGTKISGARSWYQFGSFSFQPSEFAKFATCLMLARYLGEPEINIKRFKTKFLSLALIFLPVGLILLQPDMGSALVFFSLILVLYREGFPAWTLVVGLVAVVLFVLSLVINVYILMGIIAAAVLMLIYFSKTTTKNIFTGLVILVASCGFVYTADYAFDKLEKHQKDRINVLLGKEVDLRGVGYNVNQSKIAIGSGGFFGKGFLKGTQTKFNFVPEQSTDFIFCTVGEEWGLVGCTVVLGLFLWLIARLIMMAERQRTVFGRVYGYGVACILFFHVFVNVGMAIGVLPVIGIPLPFFSYGGSSLWAFTLLLFVFVKQDASRVA